MSSCPSNRSDRACPGVQKDLSDEFAFKAILLIARELDAPRGGGTHMSTVHTEIPSGYTPKKRSRRLSLYIGLIPIPLLVFAEAALYPAFADRPFAYVIFEPPLLLPIMHTFILCPAHPAWSALSCCGAS